MHDDDHQIRSPRRPWSGFFIEATVAATAFVVAALVAAELTGAEPGSTADWFAACAGFAAFLAATVAGSAAFRALALEQKRDQQRQEAELRDQARLIAVWGLAETATAVTAGDDGEPLLTSPYVDSFNLTLRNASLMPVFEMWVQFYVNRSGSMTLLGEYPVGLLEPETTKTVDVVHDRIAVGHLDRWLAGVDPSGPLDFQFRLGWSFLDNAGVRWVRTPDQVLRPGDRPLLSPEA